MEQSHSGKLIVALLVKKFQASDVTRKFITVFLQHHSNLTHPNQT
jgi:hypothetical protein